MGDLKGEKRASPCRYFAGFTPGEVVVPGSGPPRPRYAETPAFGMAYQSRAHSGVSPQGRALESNNKMWQAGR